MFKVNSKTSTLIFSILIATLSYYTLFKEYEKPKAFFWDENYFVAAAQKYLNNVFFMEPHPPLGKLLIAAGEYLYQENDKNDQFISVDYAASAPAGFSLKGYRFFPVLLATFCPLLLFLTCRVFVGNLTSFFVAVLFATDNALIVHLRGAMLEGTQLFFVLCFLLTLSIASDTARKYKSAPSQILPWLNILIGIFFAGVLTTKVNGIVLCILFLPYFWVLIKGRQFLFQFANVGVGFILMFFLVWNTHFSLGRNIQDKLPDGGYYQASSAYKQSLQNDAGNSIGFLAKLYNHLTFLTHYTKGVPELNYCKKEENGSPWYWWIVGGKSISYRWDKENNLTRFIYLVANPLGWFLSLFGIFITLVTCVYHLFFVKQPLEKRTIVATFLLLSWISYIIIFGTLGRVMYLYHYFLPLLMGWLMLALVAPTIPYFAGIRINQKIKTAILALFFILQIASFQYFSPLTYAKELSDQEVKNRNWLKVWDIHCAGCDSENPLAQPLGDARRNITTNISVSGITAVESFQEWGDPRMNKSVTKEPLVVAGVTYTSGLGVHSYSQLVFKTNKKLRSFESKVAMPDYLKSKNLGSVVFKVLGDGREIWRSGIIKPGDLPQEVKVDISDYDRVDLTTEDAGDGNNSDHALWLEPQFK